MNPWNIFGWILVFFSLLPPFLFLVVWIGPILVRMFNHYRTRNTPPAEGQIWIQCGEKYKIAFIHPNGDIVMKSGMISFCQSKEKWKERIIKTKSFLKQ